MSKKFHYVYKLTHPNTGEFYYGVRTSSCKPSSDSYMGSMVTWKPDKSILKKEILKEFKTRKSAEKYEVKLISNDIYEDLNRNYHISGNFIIQSGYVPVRHKDSKDIKGNYFRVSVNDPRYLNGDLITTFKNKKHSKETKNKIINSMKGKKPQLGRMFINKDNKCTTIKKEDWKLYESNGWIKGGIKSKKAKLREQKMKELKLKNKNIREQKKKIIIDKKIENIKNSNINFGKYGWVIPVSKILGISHQKVNGWMKRNMNDFYVENCFKRKNKN